ncbi:MAG: twin-arginine translocation signal domain-containing protein, partial [Caldilineaceae bacterium]|nr:twin-arginine translocation signal domain-containing protein [Caldilineaceae bacterium]
MAHQRLSRRTFLHLSAGAAAMTALAACATMPASAPATGETAASADGITISFLNRGGQFIEGVMG